MRLFTAIDPPVEMQLALSEFCYGVPRIRWMPAEQLHLTLVFIGEVQPALLQPIIDQLSGIDSSPFRLTCQGLASFRSGVLWLGVNDCPELLALQRTIAQRLRRIEALKLASRRYQPHLTLGRLPRRRPPDLGNFIAQHQRQMFSFEVSSFRLESSLLLPRGAQHRCEAQFSLPST